MRNNNKNEKNNKLFIYSCTMQDFLTVMRAKAANI